MNLIEKFTAALDSHLQLRSIPIAIKFLTIEDKIPEDTYRPFRDSGERVRPCAGWHLVRHEDKNVTLFLEDISSACPSGLIIFGFVLPPVDWLNGVLSNGIYASSKKASIEMEKHVDKLELGKYSGINFAPLNKPSYTPDLIMIFCNSKDIRRLILAAEWETGEPIQTSLAARDLCAEGVVRPFIRQKPVVAIPCGGDRLHGATQDDELVFTTPLKQIPSIIDGLNAFEQAHAPIDDSNSSKFKKMYKEMSNVLDKMLGR